MGRREAPATDNARGMMSRRTAFAVASLVCLGVAPATAAPAAAAVPHTVQPGETLWSIALSQNLTTRTVAAYNGLSETAGLVAGTTVQIPTVDEGAAALAAIGVDPAVSADASGETGGSHVVQPGETLSAIAAANGLSAESLAAANGRSADAYVYIGETLQLPVAAGAASATADLGHIPSPYGELHLDPVAANDWNAMREESLRAYGQDLYPAGPLSAYRTYDQQAQLYDEYLNGTGPPAAPPGTSNHENGTAVDVETDEMRWVVDQIGGVFGWAKTEAPTEWWHVTHAP